LAGQTRHTIGQNKIFDTLPPDSKTLLAVLANSGYQNRRIQVRQFLWTAKQIPIILKPLTWTFDERGLSFICFVRNYQKQLAGIVI
jgi:hypothetical protein